METGGASLAAGAQQPAERPAEGRLVMVDATTFEPGRNLAMTPGKVVLPQPPDRADPVRADDRRRSMQVPIMIMPPWINKYYILDMQPKNSMVKYLVEQGFTVFMVSLEEPRRLDGRHHVRRLHGLRPAGGSRRGAGHHRQRHRQSHGLLHRRNAADHRRWHGWRHRETTGSARPPSWCRCRISAEGRRHRHLHGRATRSTSSSSR